ncbi:ABC transporter permease [Nocardia gipuzkoensis]
MPRYMQSLSGLLSFYSAAAKNQIYVDSQYRFGQFVYMSGFICEPIIYLTVWQAVAAARGGAIDGYSSGMLAAYYVAWIFVRVANLVQSPAEFEHRVQRGSFNSILVQPIHPVHRDLARFLGSKMGMYFSCLPLVAVMIVVFDPLFRFSYIHCLAFAFALVFAYIIRSLYNWVVGMAAFWSTRVQAYASISVLLEMILSGRLLPVQIMPPSLYRVAIWSPFYCTFGFPIDVLVGGMDDMQAATGLAKQVLWVAVFSAVIWIVWRRAVRRYTAVGV